MSFRTSAQFWEAVCIAGLFYLHGCGGGGSHNVPQAFDAPVPSGNASVTLKWEAPSSRENGEFLIMSELGGYAIWYKKVGDQNYTELKVNEPTLFSITVRGLSNGQYEFKIAAFDTQGLCGAFSEPVTKSIQ